MKKLIIYTLVSFYISGCGGNSDDNIDSQDFLFEAASISKFEIAAGNLATKKANSNDVVNYAGLEVTDHQQIYNEMKIIGENLGTTVPDTMVEEKQKKYASISVLIGYSYDSAYMSTIIQEQEYAIKRFEMASVKANQDAVKNFASKSLPMLKENYDKGKSILSTLKP